MAVCAFCQGEMTDTISCSVTAFHLAGRHFALIPYGQETHWEARSPRCGDCGTPRGGWHHPGCDIQQCPACGWQMLSCECWFDEYGPEDGGVPVEPTGVDGNGCLTERLSIGDTDLIVHYDDLPASDVTEFNGLPITTPLRTVIDVAPELEADELERVVDDCLQRHLFTVEEAWERLAQPDMAGRRGAEMLGHHLTSRSQPGGSS